MATSDSTCWTVIQAAAADSGPDREAFARRYGPAVRAYLAARWRSSPCLHDRDDAVQEVFVECFKPAGVLDRADRERGFRPFLYGVARNVALRAEAARGRQRERQPADDLDLAEVAEDAPSLSQVFDRAWARALLREAAEVMRQRAEEAGAVAGRRVELLRLRVHDNLPIRDIAARWQVDAAAVHHEYARARQEFRAALVEVVTFHHQGPAADIDRECANLLSVLG